MSWLLSLFTGGAGGIAIYLVVALVSGASAGWVVHKVDSASYETLELSISAANQKALVQAVANQKKADAISTAAETANIQKQVQIVTQTQTVIQKVPVYVTEKTDTTFPLPCGALRLWDAAASGSDPGSITLAPGLVDASPCPVAISTATEVIVSNYGQYRSLAAQLTALQDWITAENTK